MKRKARGEKRRPRPALPIARRIRAMIAASEEAVFQDRFAREPADFTRIAEAEARRAPGGS
jgi:hypothetical protein